jgi:hypothetical protein
MKVLVFAAILFAVAVAIFLYAYFRPTLELTWFGRTFTIF